MREIFILRLLLKLDTYTKFKSTEAFSFHHLGTSLSTKQSTRCIYVLAGYLNAGIVQAHGTVVCIIVSMSVQTALIVGLWEDHQGLIPPSMRKKTTLRRIKEKKGDLKTEGQAGRQAGKQLGSNREKDNND